MIQSVELFPNGMVAVFDENGEQMSKYQGRFYAVRPIILRDAPKTAEFFMRDLTLGTCAIASRQQFADMFWHYGLDRNDLLIIVESVASAMTPRSEDGGLEDRVPEDADRIAGYDRVCEVLGLRFKD